MVVCAVMTETEVHDCEPTMTEMSPAEGPKLVPEMVSEIVAATAQFTTAEPEFVQEAAVDTAVTVGTEYEYGMLLLSCPPTVTATAQPEPVPAGIWKVTAVADEAVTLGDCKVVMPRENDTEMALRIGLRFRPFKVAVAGGPAVGPLKVPGPAKKIEGAS